MNNCMFKFGSTWWLQRIGTAMGTPCACIYAILFFAYFERTILLRKYRQNLLLFVRQIDDIFGVWVDIENNPNAWEDFQYDLNHASKLDWITTDLSRKVDFLDITISVDVNGNLWTKTFQKPMNLFLYIPPHSAHPPGLMKSLIYGLLKTYYLQNSRSSDFLNMVKLLFLRLQHRGHKSADIRPLFIEAVRDLENYNDPMVDKKKKAIVKDSNDNRLFFHIPFHPRDISRAQIRNLYERICEKESKLGNLQDMLNEETGNHMKIKQLTVAYSRPKNLRDYLCPSALFETTDINVSRYV